MRDAFGMLRSYPTIGDFLAYQFVTDLNYSEVTDFSEMEFVVPGPGALDGIHKCFADLGGLTEADLIRMVTRTPGRGIRASSAFRSATFGAEGFNSSTAKTFSARSRSMPA